MENNKNKEVFHKTSINWYPGHMVTAQNNIKQSLKLIDVVVEVLDARIPLASRNPLIDTLTQNKPRIIALNKVDLADDKKTLEFKLYFENKGFNVVLINSKEGDNIKELINCIKQVGNEVYNKNSTDKIDIENKIQKNNIYRVLILGIPNVGKSTLINKISRKNSANVGNKPGVTKTNQWIRVDDNIDLLDTPGLLWPKIDGENVGEKLALTGNIKQEVLDVEYLAVRGIDMLLDNSKYKDMLIDKYNLQDENLDVITYDILELIGRKRGCLMKGNQVDMTRAAKVFLEDFKSGRIGKITLDNVE